LLRNSSAGAATGDGIGKNQNLVSHMNILSQRW
jgi:hypothetical protein